MVSKMALRESRGSRAVLFDGLEEGGVRASSSVYKEHGEQENERSLEGLEERVGVLKRLTADIHDEVYSHNRLLDRTINAIDASKGLMSGLMERFTGAMNDKSSRTVVTVVALCVALVLVIYYLRKW